MEYQNRIPPEDINTPGRHPLKEFVRLSFFALLALLVIGLLLNYSGGRLGGFIPFEVEKWLTSKMDAAMVNAGEDSPFTHSEIDTPLEAYLQRLSMRVQDALGVADPISITVHYNNENTINAYATLGGHVYLFKGLLEQLPHENALAMLMAHEFSHVVLRHPAKGIGGGLAVAVGTALLPVESAFDNRFYALTSRITSMSFSRDMEESADEHGLAAVQKMYGHVNGADDLFELFMRQRQQSDARSLETFLSTHPLDSTRIGFIKEHAESHGWPLSGRLTDLPEDFRQWLNR